MISFFRKQKHHLKARWFYYGLETIVVVIGILVALAVDNWNNNRKERQIEHTILTEISKGLSQDLIVIGCNRSEHNSGLAACDYMRLIINNEQVNADSFQYYYHYLTRDYVTIFNTSGYESLKSRGLELIESDSLRIEIISLYEQDYTILEKMEEEYHEMQYHDNYYKEINNLLSPNIVFNREGEIASVKLPLNLMENEQQTFLSYLWKIKRNRDFSLVHYSKTEKNIRQLIMNINKLKTEV